MMILEVGCGIRRYPGTTIAIDKCPESHADIFRDVAKRGIPFNDNYFDEVRAFDMLEHVEHYDDFIFLMNEIWRVLVPDGLFHFTTPNGVQHGFAHPTHHRVFIADSFNYFGEGLTETFEYARVADGIKARFRLTWMECDPALLEGKFYAIK